MVEKALKTGQTVHVFDHINSEHSSLHIQIEEVFNKMCDPEEYKLSISEKAIKITKKAK